MPLIGGTKFWGIANQDPPPLVHLISGLPINMPCGAEKRQVTTTDVTAPVT